MLTPRNNLISISGYIGSGKDTFAKLILLAIYNNVYKEKDGEIFPTSDFLLNKGLEEVTNKYFGWEIKKFADKLKEIAALLLGAKREDFESEFFKNSYLGPEWKGENNESTYTVRTFLQRLGTEAIRNNLHYNTWVNALFADYVPLDEEKRASMGNVLDYSACSWPKWIITDTRFLNEVEAIKNRHGILIRIDTTNFPLDKRIVYSREGKLLTSVKPTHISETALDDYNQWDEVITNTGTLSDLYDAAKFIVEKYKLT